MATVDLTDKAVIKGLGSHIVMQQTIDFAETNRTAADLLQLFHIGAGQVVERAQIHVETAEGGVLTVDLGDTTDPNGLVVAANGNSAGYYNSNQALTVGTPDAFTGYSQGKFFTADGTVDLLVNNNADAAKLHVSIQIADMSSP